MRNETKQAIFANLKELRGLSASINGLLKNNEEFVTNNTGAIVNMAKGLVDISEATKTILEEEFNK